MAVNVPEEEGAKQVAVEVPEEQAGGGGGPTRRAFYVVFYVVFCP